MKNRITAMGVLLMAGLAPASALSLPIFRADVTLGSIGQDERTSDSPVSADLMFHSGFEGLNFYSATGFASAQPGSLRTSSQSAIFLDPAVDLGLGSLFNTSDATASFRLDDVVISGGDAGSTVLASLNLELDGALNTATFAQLGSGSFNESQALAGVGLTVCFFSCAPGSGSRFTGSVFTGSLSDVDTQVDIDGEPNEFDLLSGFTDGAAQGAPFGIVTPSIHLPVGTPFSLLLELTTHTEAWARNTIEGSIRQADASSLFDSTLSFPVSGPVFNLPDGFTVQSVSGLIANNAWQAGPDAPEPIPVPEPGTAWLLACSLLTLVGLAPRRRHAPWPGCGFGRDRV